MDFDLTEEQRLIRDTARDFAAREIAPKAAELDKTGRWPTEIVQRLEFLLQHRLVEPLQLRELSAPEATESGRRSH